MENEMKGRAWAWEVPRSNEITKCEENKVSIDLEKYPKSNWGLEKDLLSGLTYKLFC